MKVPCCLQTLAAAAWPLTAEQTIRQPWLREKIQQSLAQARGPGNASALQNSYLPKSPSRTPHQPLSRGKFVNCTYGAVTRISWNPLMASRRAAPTVPSNRTPIATEGSSARLAIPSSVSTSHCYAISAAGHQSKAKKSEASRPALTPVESLRAWVVQTLTTCLTICAVRSAP